MSDDQTNLTQIEEFRKKAGELECDDNEENFARRLKGLLGKAPKSHAPDES